MLLWLLSAVILLLFHIKGPVSHWLYKVQCFYFSKNKKVTKGIVVHLSAIKTSRNPEGKPWFSNLVAVSALTELP